MDVLIACLPTVVHSVQQGLVGFEAVLPPPLGVLIHCRENRVGVLTPPSWGPGVAGGRMVEAAGGGALLSPLSLPSLHTLHLWGIGM